MSCVFLPLSRCVMEKTVAKKRKCGESRSVLHYRAGYSRLGTRAEIKETDNTVRKDFMYEMILNGVV